MLLYALIECHLVQNVEHDFLGDGIFFMCKYTEAQGRAIASFFELEQPHVCCWMRLNYIKTDQILPCTLPDA